MKTLFSSGSRLNFAPKYASQEFLRGPVLTFVPSGNFSLGGPGGEQDLLKINVIRRQAFDLIGTVEVCIF